MPKMVISGSVSQKEDILRLKKKLEKMGNIVETPNFDPEDTDIDQLTSDHLKKIDESDAVVVLLKDCMIVPTHTLGYNTSKEVEYCINKHPMKPIYYITLEEVNKRWFK